MKKQRNCWLYGFTRSAAILLIVAFPRLITNGVPDRAYVFANLAALAIGTLLLGGIERYYRSEPDNK